MRMDRSRPVNADGQWVGGPMYYIQNGLGFKWLAVLFAFFVCIACLGTGNGTDGAGHGSGHCLKGADA